MKEKLIELKGEIESSTIIVGGMNTLLIITDRVNRQKINKENGRFNTINQRPSRHIQNVPPNESKKHILLECMWNILEDRPNIKS